jgi:hypothetical protein
MLPAVRPGRLLKRELSALVRELTADPRWGSASGAATQTGATKNDDGHKARACLGVL